LGNTWKKLLLIKWSMLWEILKKTLKLVWLSIRMYVELFPSVLCFVPWPVFVWCPAGLFAGTPVLLGRVWVASAGRRHSLLILFVHTFYIMVYFVWNAFIAGTFSFIIQTSWPLGYHYLIADHTSRFKYPFRI
jgi:hypothetical protein